MISDRIYPTPTPQLICAFSIFRERLLLASIDEIMYRKTYLYQKSMDSKTTALSNQYLHMIYMTENGHGDYYCSFVHLALFSIFFNQ